MFPCVSDETVTHGNAIVGREYRYSAFTLTWIIVNDFQVEFFAWTIENNGNWVFVKKTITKLEWTDYSYSRTIKVIDLLQGHDFLHLK